MREAAQQKALLYDRAGEEHYNVISAFIKSMRGSDPDAALYWMMRMVEAGEDPLFIARRMVIFASEDVGNADPRALQIAIAVKDAVDFVGMPEGVIPLAQGVTYLACAPKSNASYRAMLRARADDAQTRRAAGAASSAQRADAADAQGLGYGKDYRYPHDSEGALNEQNYLPDELASGATTNLRSAATKGGSAITCNGRGLRARAASVHRSRPRSRTDDARARRFHQDADRSFLTDNPSQSSSDGQLPFIPFASCLWGENGVGVHRRLLISVRTACLYTSNRRVGCEKIRKRECRKRNNRLLLTRLHGIPNLKTRGRRSATSLTC